MPSFFYHLLTDPQPDRHSLRLAMLMALSFILSLSVPALSIFCYHSTMLSFALTYLAVHLVSLAIPLFFICTIAIYSLHRWRYFGHLLLPLLFVILIIWLQGNLLGPTVPYDLADYLANSNLSLLRVILFFLPYPLLAVAMYLWQNAFLRHIYRILLGLIIASAIIIVMALSVYHPRKVNTNLYTFDDSRKFAFSIHENILCIVVSSMGEAVFKETLEHYPELKTAFRDFTVFEQMSNPNPHNDLASSNILFNTMNTPDEQNQDTAQSLVTMFKRRGYRCEAYPPFQQIFTHSPLVLDNIFSNNNHALSRQNLTRAWKERMIPLLIQWIFPACIDHTHPNHITNDSELLDASDNSTFDQTPDSNFQNQLIQNFSCSQNSSHLFKYFYLNGLRLSQPHSDQTADSPETGAVNQLRESLSCLAILLELLNQHGLYDRSLIVITGDHAPGNSPETIMLIKTQNIRQNAITYNSSPCTVYEIAPTLLAEKGFISSQQSLCKRPGTTSQPAPPRKRLPQTSSPLQP